MAKLLIVDDEREICALIEKYAKYEGYEVCCAYDGAEALRLCETQQFDLVILDVMMPVMDGFTTAIHIRKTQKTPIIMLSARGEEYDRIHGFELGVDDYVVKPFSPRELMLRAAAVIKRSTAEETVHESYRYKTLHIDFTARTVTVDGQRLELSPKEYELLFYMVKNRGIALSREKLLNAVWGYDFFGVDRTLDTHIKLLRKKLGEYAACITTLRGVGYRFEEPQN
ncbi:MAG: response regulator transcription factor [Oscillospiraceae bacterium]|nr:response regulator transcription factor [Oscillospiraceae bacterium]